MRLIVSSALFIGCTHKPELPVLPIKPLPPVVVNACDTTNVSYKKDVQPVLNANCYSCHGTAVTAGGGLDLENFTSLKTYLQQGFRGDGVYGSKFYHCITHKEALPMPPGYLLDTCTLNKIGAWISRGAADN